MKERAKFQKGKPGQNRQKDNLYQYFVQLSVSFKMSVTKSIHVYMKLFEQNSHKIDFLN